jgi:uncharacterized glyoxalase superfamily protein PhnB
VGVKKLSALHQELIPYLYYRDPGAAADFLAKAFGFTLRGMHRDDAGRVMHAELGVGKSAVMMGPAHAELGFSSVAELPARHAGVWCYVDDADAHCAKARAAGATIVREPCDQFYGVREYTARDVEGQEWFFATPLAGAAPAPKRKPAKRAKSRAAKAPARRKQAAKKK